MNFLRGTSRLTPARCLRLAAAACWGLALSVQAQQEVRIGVIYPLTGAAASSGATKTVTIISDGTNWTLIKNGN